MPTRLNIFALPMCTTLLFGLIVLILFVPVVASLFWQTPICGAQLFVVMLLLPPAPFSRSSRPSGRKLAAAYP